MKGELAIENIAVAVASPAEGTAAEEFQAFNSTSEPTTMEKDEIQELGSEPPLESLASITEESAEKLNLEDISQLIEEVSAIEGAPVEEVISEEISQPIPPAPEEIPRIVEETPIVEEVVSKEISHSAEAPIIEMTPVVEELSAEILLPISPTPEAISQPAEETPILPAVEEAVSEEILSLVEDAPFVEEAPVVEDVLISEEISHLVEETPVIEVNPVVEELLSEEISQPISLAPEETLQFVEETPLVDEVVSEEISPLVEEAPAFEEITAHKIAPIVEETKAVEEPPAVEQEAISEEGPTGQDIIVVEGNSIEATPVFEEPTAVEEVSVAEEAPAVEESVVYEFSVVEETAVVTPTTEGKPVQEETAAEESKLLGSTEEVVSLSELRGEPGIERESAGAQGEAERIIEEPEVISRHSLF